jgi:hypothetical protein
MIRSGGDADKDRTPGVALADRRAGEFGNRSVFTAFHHPFPSVRAGDRLDERVVHPGLLRRRPGGAASRCKDELTAATLLQRKGNSDFKRMTSAVPDSSKADLQPKPDEGAEATSWSGLAMAERTADVQAHWTRPGVLARIDAALGHDPQNLTSEILATVEHLATQRIDLSLPALSYVKRAWQKPRALEGFPADRSEFLW